MLHTFSFNITLNFEYVIKHYFTFNSLKYTFTWERLIYSSEKWVVHHVIFVQTNTPYSVCLGLCMFVLSILCAIMFSIKYIFEESNWYSPLLLIISCVLFKSKVQYSETNKDINKKKQGREKKCRRGVEIISFRKVASHVSVCAFVREDCVYVCDWQW